MGADFEVDHLKDFGNLEREYDGVPIEVSAHPGLTGSLRLDGEKTSVKLLGDFVHAPIETTEGWFDLELTQPSGQRMLLHNAITDGSTTYHGHANMPRMSYNVFPNVVVDDVKGLTSDHKVASIHFRLPKLDSFFAYDVVEGLDMSKVKSKSSMLRELRYDFRSDDELPFVPQSAWVMHDVPELFAVDVGARRYSAWFTGAVGLGNRGRLRVDLHPLLVIGYDEPVSLDAAIDSAHDWRRWFSNSRWHPYHSLGSRCRVLGIQRRRAQIFTCQIQPAQRANTRRAKTLLPTIFR